MMNKHTEKSKRKKSYEPGFEVITVVKISSKQRFCSSVLLCLSFEQPRSDVVAETPRRKTKEDA